VPGDPIRRATPTDWAEYARVSGTAHTIVVVNQLTANLTTELDGLAAHHAAGTVVRAPDP
jgi:hypothetical protein